MPQPVREEGYEARGDKYYKLYTSAADHHTASGMCNDLGARLAMFKTREDIDVVKAYRASAGSDMWVGLVNPALESCQNKVDCRGVLRWADGSGTDQETTSHYSVSGENKPPKPRNEFLNVLATSRTLLSTTSFTASEWRTARGRWGTRAAGTSWHSSASTTAKTRTAQVARLPTRQANLIPILSRSLFRGPPGYLPRGSGGIRGLRFREGVQAPL